MDPSERRKYRRYHVEGMKIACRTILATEVNIIDISLGGAQVRLNRRLSMGRKYAMTVMVNGSPVVLDGQVVWEKIIGSESNAEGDVVPVYEVGINFTDTLTDKGTRVIEFIRTSAHRPGGSSRLRGLRIHVEEQQKRSVLDHHEHCRVIRLAEGGMLIVAHEAMEKGREIRLDLALSEDIPHLRVIGRVTSCAEKSDAPPAYAIGIRFEQISEEDRSNLRMFLKVIDPGRDKGGAVKPKPPGESKGPA